jgi:hypothetical protein
MNDTIDSLERLSASAGSVTPKREMGMMAWLATEGGRKCPACGKYAKAEELGYTGGTMMMGGVLTHISSYGHLEGYGCNRSQNKEYPDTPKTGNHDGL